MRDYSCRGCGIAPAGRHLLDGIGGCDEPRIAGRLRFDREVANKVSVTLS
jgi:hypothetical protein